MGLDAKVRKLREDALAKGGTPVPETFQGVAKTRIKEVLRALDRESADQVDAVFALLDDVHDSWFPGAPTGMKFCEGATVAHIASHVGILQRGGVKLDREGRDYWIKPLRDIGAVEPIIFDKKARSFLPGHPVAKSPNSAHRPSDDFKRILRASASTWKAMLANWIKSEKIRERLAFQAAQAEDTRRRVDTSHGDLIKACVEHYAPRFLPGFEVVYVDDSDGDRIDDEDRERLRDSGLTFQLGDAMPDVLLHNGELRELWVIEAVTSDGEVDEQKVRQMHAFANRNQMEGVGFTTTYSTGGAANYQAPVLQRSAEGCA